MKVRFRKIEQADLELIKDWRNQDRIRMNSRDRRLLNMDDQSKWFQKISTSDKDDMYLVLKDEVPIGVCGLAWIDQESRSAEITFYLGEQSSPVIDVALGFEGYEFLKKKGFEELSLNRLHGEIFSFNEGGIKLAAYCGFKKEGTKKQAIFWDGKYWDSIMVSMLAEEYRRGRRLNNHIKIADRLIGRDQPPFIIAEMSGNHNQSLERALAIVEAAAKSGVHAVKLQTFTADALTLDIDDEVFCVSDPASPWHGQSLYKLYQQACTPMEWHEPIFKRCHELGLIAFSSPFDEAAVDFLEGLDVPAYKIASSENIHLPLIRKAAATGKPLLISTGMATENELEEAVNAAREAGCKDIILLKCTTAYPATPENTNLMTIPHLKERFGVEAGLSDHTLGIGAAVAGVALGASVIEKHFTLKRSDGGVDTAFSMEPDEMEMLTKESHRAWQAKGKVFYGVTEGEKSALKFRRSIYVVEDVKEGEHFTSKNLRVIRPADGLPPKHYEDLLNRKAACDIQKGTPMNWSNAE